MINQKIYYVGIYVRLSKDDERAGESVSIENQKMLLEKYVKDQSWNLVDIYADDGYSGTNFERPEFKRMIEDAKDGKINLILVKDLSRFGRNYIQVGQFTDYIFPTIGCRFIALNDGVDTIHNENDIMPFRNLFNEFYSRDTSKKIKSVKKINAQNGRYLGTCAPYGYIKSPDDKHKFIIDEQVAPNVKRIFELRRQGVGYRRIAQILNQDGIMPARDYYYMNKGEENPRYCSHLWSDTAVKHLVRNEVYIGNMVQMKSGTLSYKNRKQIAKPKNEWIRVENTHEPIIDMETWNIVQELDNKRYKPRGTGNGIENIFMGLIKCADCGTPMRFNQETQVRKNGDKVVYLSYLCGLYSRSGKSACSTHTIYFNTLSKILLEEIRNIAKMVTCDEERIITELTSKFSTDCVNQQSTFKTDLKNLKSRLAELEKLSQNLYEDKVSGKIPENLFLTLIQKYESERIEKLDMYDKLNAQLQNMQKNQLDVSKWVELIKKYVSVEQLDREMLVELIEKIEISERSMIDGVRHQEIKIHYNFVGNIN